MANIVESFREQLTKSRLFIRKVQFVAHAPVSIFFVFLTVVVFLYTLGGSIGRFAAIPLYNSRLLLEPSFWTALFAYPLAHASLAHLTGNLSLILLLAPLIEGRLGPHRFVALLLFTTFVGGVANALFSSNAIVGASGIVFMLIILTPLAHIGNDAGQGNQLPVSCVMLFLLHTGKELSLIFADDGVSHLGHIVGGTFGALVGLALRSRDFHKHRQRRNPNILLWIQRLFQPRISTMPQS